MALLQSDLGFMLDFIYQSLVSVFQLHVGSPRLLKHLLTRELLLFKVVVSLFVVLRHSDKLDLQTLLVSF
jgi:hypothetical protein